MLSAPAHPPTLLSPHHYTTPSTRPHLVPLTVGGRADVVSAVIARVVRALSAVRERGSAGRRVRKCAQEAIEEEHLRPTAGNAFASGPRAFAHAAKFHRPVLDPHPTICASSTFTPFTRCILYEPFLGPLEQRRRGRLSHAVQHRQMVLGRNYQASLQHDHAAVKAQVRERERLREAYVETVAPPERVSGRDGT